MTKSNLKIKKCKKHKLKLVEKATLGIDQFINKKLIRVIAENEKL
jgi:hypothetical protein